MFICSKHMKFMQNHSNGKELEILMGSRCMGLRMFYCNKTTNCYFNTFITCRKCTQMEQ